MFSAHKQVTFSCPAVNNMRFNKLSVAQALLSLTASRVLASQHDSINTPAPEPEPIEVYELPLPPTIANTTEGACTLDINPRGTGCITQWGLISGDFSPDGRHVLAGATFVGAPADSIYTGAQLFYIKVDGTTFPNGDPWKCITCGVPVANQNGVTLSVDYPQTFTDGTRAMAGTIIIDCGSAQLTSAACTPNSTHFYPIRVSDTADDDGTGTGLYIRELRLHPDQAHFTFNSFISSGGALGELTAIGRLQFNEAGARYDAINVTILSNPYLPPAWTFDGDQMYFNKSSISVGELRGLTGTGKEVTYIGNPWESCNIDLFAVDLSTGAVRRITAHPEYADPISVSPNDQWQVVMDTRASGRDMFMSGLRNIPPVIDMVTVTVASSVRNNGVRRFFQPWLIDHDGDRGTYFGQQINAAGNGSSGAINDPNWNGGADPRWSLDGTLVQYFQWLAVAPACGGSNPLACETSPYADGRAERVMIANLTSRTPLPVVDVPDISDDIPWGLKYTPGMTIPAAPVPPAGQYTLSGESSGSADVTIILDSSTNASVSSVAVTYHDYSDDGVNFLTGFENATITPINITMSQWDWYSDIKSTGPEYNGSKVTSEDGFHLQLDVLHNFFNATGTLTTTIDGVDTWYQPCNYC